MTKMIQIRNVPEDLHRELKLRANRAGMSLSDYLRSELERLVIRRPIAQVLEEWRARRAPLSNDEVVEVIRKDRQRP